MSKEELGMLILLNSSHWPFLERSEVKEEPQYHVVYMSLSLHQRLEVTYTKMFSRKLTIYFPEEVSGY